MRKLKSYELLSIQHAFDANLHLEQSVQIYKEKENPKLTSIILKLYETFINEHEHVFKNMSFILGSNEHVSPMDMPCYAGEECIMGKIGSLFLTSTDESTTDYFSKLGLSKEAIEYMTTYFPPPTARCNSCGFRTAIGDGLIWNQGCLVLTLMRLLVKTTTFKENIKENITTVEMLQIMKDYIKIMRDLANEKV